MEKERLALILFASVAFLLPVGMYCLILSSINRQARPILASGVWDSLGLLFSAAGFLLVVVPAVITEFYRKTTAAANADQVFVLWLGHWAVWLAYFVFLGSAAWLMILLRANKTVIYNVDQELFSSAWDRTLAALGMQAQPRSRTLVLGPAHPTPPELGTAFTEAVPKRANPVEDHRHGELEIETFPAMCHVTLHWGRCTSSLRQQIEQELRMNLEGAAPLENAAAGWLMTVSGLILGAATALLAALGFLLLVGAR